MIKDLHAYRKSYEKGELNESLVANDPFKQFAQWFSLADKSDIIDEANAMFLSTTGASGKPRGRIVLLKEVTKEGFVFYTNYNSEKGKAIAENNKVCISFFWPGLERQIIINGDAHKISEEKSNAYFRERPRASQLGALLSDQSDEVASREVLESKMKDLEIAYQNKEIPKPKDWGGYLVIPSSFEFWQGRPSRLHDRLVYTLQNDVWSIKRLQP